MDEAIALLSIAPLSALLSLLQLSNLLAYDDVQKTAHVVIALQIRWYPIRNQVVMQMTRRCDMCEAKT